MKKFVSQLSFMLSLSALSAFPWVDEAFRIVETGSQKEVQRTIDTDYSFSDFTRTDDKENLLMAALKNSRGNDVVDLLLKQAKISPDSKTKSGKTAFMYACQYETNMAVIENMLNTGAEDDKAKNARILTRDNNNQTAFDYARKNEVIEQEVLDYIGKYAEEPPRETPPEQDSPKVPEEPEETPVQEEPKPELPIEENSAPEIAPAQNSIVDLASVASPTVIPESIRLYDYADTSAALAEIPAALIAAEEAKKHFIEDANKTDSKGRTKLMMAAKKGEINIIEDLLFSGAGINARDEDGWTALMYAARFQKDADVTKLLLYKGADRSIKNKYGISALMLASGYSESSDVISAILSTYSPDSDEAREAFSYGISNSNSPKALQAFIDQNVPVNIPYNGKTPLIVAAQTNKNTKIIEWLLENDASKSYTESATGKTAFDYAKENRKLPHNVAYWSLNPNSEKKE